MTEERGEPATPETPEPIVAPYGSWASPITIDSLAGASRSLSEAWLDGDDVYWLEGRSTEGGRRTLLRHGPDGATRELTPAPFYVRSRVHEYGGGAYVADAGRVIASGADNRLYRVDPDALTPPEPFTPDGPWRYADLRFDPRGGRLYAVRETHDVQRPNDPLLVTNELVSIALDGSSEEGTPIAGGADFYAAPRASPDGSRLAWMEWDHPNMPWDSVRLRIADVAPDGSLVNARTIAGGPGISVVQPSWSPAGVLHFVSDETEWWNLYAFDGPDGVDGPARNLSPMEAELGDPAWTFGRETYGFLADGAILAVARFAGRDHYLRIDPEARTVELETPFSEVISLRVAGDRVVTIAAGPATSALAVRLDPVSGEVRGVLGRARDHDLDPGVLPVAEPIEFASGSGATARALYFPPTNAGYRGPDGELPPLIVESHGGPTGAAASSLSLDRAFFTSRGIAVVDVDYRGSTGYGRPYRDALKGQWGIADVEDCVAAARFLADRGDVDPERLAIRGGSAGGYTTLASLTFQPDVFAAGLSHFGIADLELIHKDGHKFESRYDEGLVAPYDTPEGRQIFRDRSPIHFFDRIRAPMLILQGLEDRVVPPSQVDAMEEMLDPRGVPYVALRFEGEGHGFRRAETRRAAYEAELAFLGRVFGFTPADDVPPLEIPGLDEFRAATSAGTGGGAIR